MNTPEVGFKTGWTNPLVLGSGSNLSGLDSPSMSPRISTATNQDSPASYRLNQQQQRRRTVRSRLTNSVDMDEVEMNNVVTMVCFATALMENLARINRGKLSASASASIGSIILPLEAAVFPLMSPSSSCCRRKVIVFVVVVILFLHDAFTSFSLLFVCRYNFQQRLKVKEERKRGSESGTEAETETNNRYR